MLFFSKYNTNLVGQRSSKLLATYFSPSLESTESDGKSRDAWKRARKAKRVRRFPGRCKKEKYRNRRAEIASVNFAPVRCYKRTSYSLRVCSSSDLLFFLAPFFFFVSVCLLRHRLSASLCIHTLNVCYQFTTCNFFFHFYGVSLEKLLPLS